MPKQRRPWRKTIWIRIQENCINKNTCGLEFENVIGRDLTRSSGWWLHFSRDWCLLIATCISRGIGVSWLVLVNQCNSRLVPTRSSNNKISFHTYLLCFYVVDMVKIVYVLKCFDWLKLAIILIHPLYCPLSIIIFPTGIALHHFEKEKSSIFFLKPYF